MNRKKAAAALLIMTMLLSAGCDDGANYQAELDKKKTTINQLETEVAQLKQQLEKKTAATTDAALSDADLAAKQAMLNELIEQGLIQPASDLELAIEHDPWLQKLQDYTEWTKLVISSYEDDPDPVIITDPAILSAISGEMFYLRTVGEVDYPSGYRSYYIYDLYENDDKHSFEVIDRGVIHAAQDGQYFEVAGDTDMIAKAFLEKPGYVKHDGLLAKMAASGAIKSGDEYASLYEHRILLRVWPLLDGTLLSDKPTGIGQKMEQYSFYYYGSILTMDVYSEYVHLQGDGSEEWYYLPDAELAMTNEPG